MTLLLLLSASLFATTIALFLPSLNEATKHKQQQVIPCLVSMCTSRHSQLLEEHGILMPSPSADYCLLLKDYLTCLNDSRSGCLSQLDFHSAITSTSKRWRKFQCDNFEQKKLDQTECQFWEENEPQEETAMIAAEDYASDGHFDEENEEQEEEEEELLGEEHHSHDHGAAGSVKCAIFGQLHLRRFDSNVPEWCSFSGARPLFDHRFFLIQMTSAEVAGSKNYDKSVETSAAAFHVVSKIAIILRPREGCLSTQKLYLADATDAGQLPGTFEDGTSKVGGDIGSKIIVEIVLSELGQRADILLHHLATTIRVRKFGNNKFMNILIQTPKRLLNMNYESKHLCGDGCWDSSDDFADGAHQQNHVHVHPPPLLLQSCEQQIIDRRAQDHCSRLLIGRPELRGEWTQLCVRELLHSTKSFTSADLAKSLGMTLEDLFGLNINGTELAYDQEEMRRKGEEANKCPNNLTTTTIPFSPMSPTSSCPFPHISAAVLLLYNFALLLSTAKSVFSH